MNSYLLNQVLEEARKNPAAMHPQIQSDTTPKTVSLLIPTLTYEGKTYGGHVSGGRFIGETLKMAPSHAKGHYLKNEVALVSGGACDVYKIGSLGSLMGYKPWISESESAGYTRHPEATWLRVRLTKQIQVIPGLAQSGFMRELPKESGQRRRLWPRLEFFDFYLPWWYVCQFSHSFEGENPSYQAPLEIAVPQLLPTPEPAKNSIFDIQMSCGNCGQRVELAESAGV